LLSQTNRRQSGSDHRLSRRLLLEKQQRDRKQSEGTLSKQDSGVSSRQHS